ncbi:hypothetical protein [Cognatilysobacter bugurensis]|uniref:Alanine acetyltransferase n=1 Tax=Cognatilysobacter bugurensis TaxID=543356 RepID=A0A918W8E7_9GAMM|nr:hypothetical protein [Lysobacter bugurensis]GHA85468.1 hypothetical protein GCM10007067_24330 [Lysobacter bugurensis]
MSAQWSAEQREWLQVMGYDLLMPAGAADADAEAVAVAEPPPAVEAPSEVDTRSARPAAPRGAAAPGVDLTDPLMRALLRASRCDDLAELGRLAGDLRALRRDPAAKRALWPALRALRMRSRR